VHHVIDIHLNSGSGVVKCIQLSALQNLEQASSVAFTEKCCQISLWPSVAWGKRARWTHLIMQFIFYSSFDTNPLYSSCTSIGINTNTDTSTRPNCKGSPILLDCKMNSSLPLQRESYTQCNR